MVHTQSAFITYQKGTLMTEIQPYMSGAGGLLPRDSRRVARTNSRCSAGGVVRVSSTDVETDVTLAKVDSATAVTGAAMSAVVRVAKAQQHLELLAPEASGRLAVLADEHVLAIMDVASDHRRALRRI